MAKPSNDEMRAVFNEFDSDKSGFIDVNEMKNALEQMFGETEHVETVLADMMVKLGDKNGDNKLDFEEFCNWCDQMI